MFDILAEFDNDDKQANKRKSVTFKANMNVNNDDRNVTLNYNKNNEKVKSPQSNTYKQNQNLQKTVENNSNKKIF